MLDPWVKVAICPLRGNEADAVLKRWGCDGDGIAAHQWQASLASCLLRTLLHKLEGISGSDWNFVTDNKGKPFVRHPSGLCAPEISISHSGTIVAAAITLSGRLGLDIEYHRRERDFVGIAQYAFGPAEASEAALSRRAFYRIWTLREAIAKATGDGLAMAADGRDRVQGSPEMGCWEREIDGELWQAAHFEPIPDYSLAIAVVADQGAEQRCWSADAIEWILPGNNQLSGIE